MERNDPLNRVENRSDGPMLPRRILGCWVLGAGICADGLVFLRSDDGCVLVLCVIVLGNLSGYCCT